MPESRISQFATDPFLVEFAQGASINATPPIQQLLAPMVEVPDLTFHYKTTTRDSRLILPNTLRQLGGHVAQIAAISNDTTGTLEIHSVDGAPLPNELGDEALRYWIQDALFTLADIRSQVTEQEAITTALASVTSTTQAVWGDEADPVAQIDAQILALMTSAKTSGVAVAFGPAAWGLFKNNRQVLEHTRGNLSFETNPGLFHGNAEYRTCYSIYDTAPTAVDQNIQFLFPSYSVLIFARAAKPSRRDPSYMKMFTLPKQRIKFKITESNDGRDIRVQLDFPQLLSVTNTSGAVLTNVKFH